jgi:hypothetical protein
LDSHIRWQRWQHEGQAMAMLEAYARMAGGGQGQTPASRTPQAQEVDEDVLFAMMGVTIKDGRRG